MSLKKYKEKIPCWPKSDESEDEDMRHYVQIWYMPESPPCRAVEMVAQMAGVPLIMHPINLANREHHHVEFKKINPALKVPYIIDKDLRMGESRAIMTYFVSQYMPNDETLYPKDPKARAKVDELLYFDMGTFYHTTSQLFRPLFYTTTKVLNYEHEKAFHDVLNLMNNHLENRRYWIGNDITIGDVSVAATLSFIDSLDYDISMYKHLVGYFNRLKINIKTYHMVNDLPVQNTRNFIQTKMGV